MSVNKSLKKRIDVAKNFLNIVRFTDKDRNMKKEREAMFLLREVELYYFEPVRGWEFFTAEHYVEEPLRKVEAIIERMVKDRNNKKGD